MGHKSHSNKKRVAFRQIPPQNPFLKELGKIYKSEQVTTDVFGRRPVLQTEIEAVVRRSKEY